MSDIGHNSGPVAQELLRSLVERIERLEESKAEVAQDLKEVYLEAKGDGFDTGPLRRIVALRKKDRAKVLEDKAVLELYATALGCLDLV